MAAPNILESYLVSLSMRGPTSAEQREAEKAFNALAESVTGIIPKITAASTAIVYATDKIANGLSKLYFESQKTGATVREISALGYALVQNGSTLEKFHDDFNKFAQTLRDFPTYRKTLIDKLGLKPEDFKDALTTYSATLKALAKMRASGNTQEEGAIRELFGLDEDNILARGRSAFDKFYAEGLERNKGIDEISEKAVALVRSLNAFSASLESVGRKAAAALFEKYGVVLGEMTKWVDSHSTEIVSIFSTVVDQFVLAWHDIEPVAVPAVHLITAAIVRTSEAIDSLLGTPDGQHGGLHAVRYALDLLAAYIAGKWALKLLGLFAVLGLRGTPAGVAAAGAYEFFSHVPKAEGDDSYGLDHPGWRPGMPKEETRSQKESKTKVPSSPSAGPPAPAPQTQPSIQSTQLQPSTQATPSTGVELEKKTSAQPVEAGDPTAGHPRYYGGTLQVGDETFHYGTGSPNRGRGSSAYGDHSITGWDPAAHHGVGGGAFRIEDQNDPNVPGGPREQVEIHEGRTEELDHLYTAGCFAVPPSEWPRARAAITEQLRSGDKVLRIGADGRASIVPKGAPNVSVKPQSRLEWKDIHSKVASLVSHPNAHRNVGALGGHPGNKWATTKINNIGTRKQVTNIQLASTDPHTSAAEIARHMKAIHAGTLRSLDRLA